ncbi:DUF3307 domain-containing protein [Listeria grandensis]|uniref:DUF3307 domain-containing protein n=1 Tax=Listeria grandensis TaxID=1494963 RepID=UPI0004AD6A0F|nr:DUF3307 domain-containing protein [Listeria grandensis]
MCYKRTKWLASKKERFSYHKLQQLGWHIFAHFYLYLLAIIVYFCWFDSKISFWALLLMILGLTIVHFIIDLAKAPIEKLFRDTKMVHLFTYISDQILHITTIYIAVWLVFNEQITLIPAQLNNYPKFCALASLAIIIVYLIGYLIPYVLEVLMPGFNLEKKSISFTKQSGKIILTKNQEIPIVSNKELKAGRYIGGLERLLLLIFMVLQIYSAIPIIIALKTLARFKELENNRTFAEYYLIGNFLSMIFGVLISLVFIYILKL